MPTLPSHNDFANDILKGFKEETFIKKLEELANFKANFTPESLRDYCLFLDREYPKGELPKIGTLMIVAVYFGQTIVNTIANASWSNKTFEVPLELELRIKHDNKTIIIDGEELELKEQIIHPVKMIANYFTMREKTLFDEYQKIHSTL